MDLKLGMYIRCSIDEDRENSRDFLIGQVIKINKDTSEVYAEFHDIYDKSMFFDYIPCECNYYIEEVDRCKVSAGSKVIYKNMVAGEVLQYCGKDENGFYNYYIKLISENNEIVIAKEKDITVQYDDGDYNPVKQLLNYEFQNPIWYKNRSIVSSYMNTIKNAPYGFELLLGSRVYLLPHQIDTIIKGISEDSCRLMLADEVGLGKTIEACVIFKGLSQRKRNFKTLIIVPESLIIQWQNELSYKFWMDVPIWEGKSSYILEDTVLISIEDILDPGVEHLLELSWDLCIVDETHRLLKDEERYSKILELSKKIENILLLSATPIQQRQSEYLSLLKLLNPSAYENMTEGRFETLLDKSRYLKDIIHELVRDLNYYIEDELGEEYIEMFQDINEELKDEILDKLISMVDIDGEDHGLEMVKVILAYISNNYEVAKDIIRNRRIELKERMASRTYELIDYKMVGAEANFYETDTYDSLIEYLDEMQNNNLDKLEMISELKRLFLSAILSSPWALESMLKGRKDHIEGIELNTNIEERHRRIIKQLAPFDGEEELLENTLFNNGRWKIESEEEFKQLDYFYENPDMIKGRLMHVADYLDENFFDEKVVIFTQWKETAQKLEELLIEKTSENKVASFYKGRSLEELELAVDRFQGSEDCNFLVCDSLGGEGRNFQMADAIFHIDLPWSPVDLEQRIGRLDRIGRSKDKDVLSISIIAKDTIEEDLFNIWNEGLNIFNESLSGIEIALTDVEEEIFNALSTDTKYGLKNSVINVVDSSTRMREEVEKERYFDYAKRLNPRREAKLSELIDIFDSYGGRALYEGMNAWGKMIGFSPYNVPVKRKAEEGVDFISTYNPSRFSINAAKNTLYYPPDTGEALKRGRNKRELAGTFSRELAINREELIFFTPGEEVFDSIIRNAINAYKGRCCAIALSSEFDWMGIIYTWQMDFNIKYLIENGISLQTKDKIYEYLPLKETITVHPITKNSLEIDDEKVLEVMEDWRNSTNRDGILTEHLGRRGSKKLLNIGRKYNSNIEWFKARLDKVKWTSLVDITYEESYKIINERFQNEIDMDSIREYYDEEIISNKASNIYYDNGELNIVENNQLKREKDAIIKSLENINLYLDSAVFVWMVRD